MKPHAWLDVDNKNRCTLVVADGRSGCVLNMQVVMGRTRRWRIDHEDHRFRRRRGFSLRRFGVLSYSLRRVASWQDEGPDGKFREPPDHVGRAARDLGLVLDELARHGEFALGVALIEVRRQRALEVRGELGRERPDHREGVQHVAVLAAVQQFADQPEDLLPLCYRRAHVHLVVAWGRVLHAQELR